MSEPSSSSSESPISPISTSSDAKDFDERRESPGNNPLLRLELGDSSIDGNVESRGEEGNALFPFDVAKLLRVGVVDSGPSRGWECSSRGMDSNGALGVVGVVVSFICSLGPRERLAVSKVVIFVM